MKAKIIAGVIVALALAPATADARPAKHKRPPLMQMWYAKHDAWETMNDYADANEQQWSGGVDEKRFSCRRVSRSVVDCKTSMLFWTSEEGCVEPGAVGYPAYGPEFDRPEHACPPGSRWGGWWEGERHSWTMRYRAGQALYTVHVERYFPRDRYASTDPTDAKFGGLALSTRAEEGV
jgi:hypothetical protein